MPIWNPTAHFTIREYLDREVLAVERHDYFAGQIYAMAGGGIVHSMIVANLGCQIGNQLVGRGCQAFDSGLKVRVEATNLLTYPDVPVVCGTPKADPLDPRGHTILNPTLLIEVLSPSTEAYDRGFKSQNYRRIPSLKEYVLVTQDSAVVEVYHRHKEGTWLLRTFMGLDAVASFDSLEIQLPLRDIYQDVVFPQPPVEQEVDNQPSR